MAGKRKTQAKKSSGVLKQISAWLENHHDAAGVLAAAVLLAFYLSMLTALNSFPHALQQLSTDWFWIALLAIGLGLQVRLHFLFQKRMHEQMAAGGTAACAGISGTAMLACCAHHATDFLPLLGLAGFAGVLYGYREAFMLFGVLSNFVASAFLLRKFNAHGIDAGIPFGVQGVFSSEKSVKLAAVGSAAIFVSFLSRLFLLR